MLEIVVGHATWVMMLQVSSLSVFSSVCPFIKILGSQTGTAWTSVREELRQVRALPLLPAARADSS